MPNSAFRTFYKFRFLIHTAFWLVWGAFYYMAAQRDVRHVLINFLSFIPCTYLVVWFTHRTIRQLYQKFENSVLARWLIVWFLSGFIFVSLDNMLYQGIVGPEKQDWIRFIYEALYSLFFVISIPVTIELIFSLINNTMRMQAMQREKFYAEKQLLMSQIHPHFLFNTLNNIYSLSLSHSEKLPSIILQMSDLLRYMLKLSKKDFITVGEEMDYIRNYIALESLRIESPENIQFKTENINESLFIAPILLLPLIENAFKHGNTSSEFMTINIEVKGNKNELTIIVQNSKRQNIAAEVEENPTSIGLGNLSKRLQIIYPDRHLLMTTDSADTYEATLSLKLYE